MVSLPIRNLHAKMSLFKWAIFSLECGLILGSTVIELQWGVKFWPAGAQEKCPQTPYKCVSHWQENSPKPKTKEGKTWYQRKTALEENNSHWWVMHTMWPISHFFSPIPPYQRIIKSTQAPRFMYHHWTHSPHLTPLSWKSLPAKNVILIPPPPPPPLPPP